MVGREPRRDGYVAETRAIPTPRTPARNARDQRSKRDKPVFLDKAATEGTKHVDVLLVLVREDFQRGTICAAVALERPYAPPMTK